MIELRSMGREAVSECLTNFPHSRRVVISLVYISLDTEDVIVWL